ncbi:receptor-like serine/threonine-protein kinase SD1-7 [Triticum aestivum]|uniref:receptor-like serine/threonine-protein kinase SD1-7 n=1 Tax=Triticum aestivum TaxID=4565 RepID=UPI001D00EA43|nr:receptor-like serine/threonine-protein kinase SD1-7 [Triticum aestivum]
MFVLFVLVPKQHNNYILDFLNEQYTTRGALLNWNRRRHIIEGVAQGLLYLHKHSRLRVIHRDLKASNILLDENMNPRISDFGLARIFGSNESHANTSRVVGTHGYMAPEYASEGQFSIKSDVFSFGVLLLEIISGKRNNGFHQTGNSGNLLGYEKVGQRSGRKKKRNTKPYSLYVWLLWTRENWCELIDPCLDVKHPNMEIMRFINVGLMCVQDDAVDRPTISDAISLLMNESTSLPDPKKPAYFRNKGEDPKLEEQYSVNQMHYGRYKNSNQFAKHPDEVHNHLSDDKLDLSSNLLVTLILWLRYWYNYF